MEFDRYAIALLLMRSDAPELSKEDEAALQDAHIGPPGDAPRSRTPPGFRSGPRISQSRFARAVDS
jgi:hypothetical protein